MSTHRVLRFAAVGIFFVAALAGVAGQKNGALPASAPSQGSRAAADGFADVEWARVRAPGGTLIAAVARPTGTGPFPVLVVLHGTHGFAREYVRLAQDLARAGSVVAVAGCWFTGGQGAGRTFVTPIDCPDAPAMSAHWSSEALESVSALVAAARELPGVRDDRVALFGHSRGAGGALRYVVERGGVRAAVLNSAGYDRMVIERAAAVGAPLLLAHGTEDGSADGTGGNEVTAFDNARIFESALRKEGKPVEVQYFDGARPDPGVSGRMGIGATERSPYFLDITADIKPEDVPFQPWAAAGYRRRVERQSKDDPTAQCQPAVYRD